MNVLRESDRVLIERQAFQCDAKPAFELLKACLVWPDELPAGISNEGREYIYDLLIIRGFIHRGLSENKWGLDSQYFIKVWQEAIASSIPWNGFRRLEISEVDRDYLIRSLGETL